jgi:hypothetical protein
MAIAHTPGEVQPLMQVYPEIRHHFIVGCLPVAGLAVPALIVWVVPGPGPDHGPELPAPEMTYFRVELSYSQAAELVNPPGA